jgi:toxin-antitoxin system PIN domain toxin
VKAALLDVNVLLALAWPDHAHHLHATQWLIDNRESKWATCPFTEAGFVRLSAHPAVVSSPVSTKDAIDALKLICTSTSHIFWSQAHSITELLPEIHERLVGHQQLTDALLLDLAIRMGGRLVTLDRRIASLLPANSSHRSAIEIVATK